jgi:GNAT superfamily N-acetyltransferase
MEIVEHTIQSTGVKFVVMDGDTEMGHAYLYLIQNDLHNEPAGYLEDMFVEEMYRGKGAGSALLNAVFAKAKELGCYKVVGTSREGKEDVHAWYERAGFRKYGYAFRMDL